MPGGGNSLLVGWFLFSPFNLIILLFDKATLPDAFFWIVCLKLCTACMSMAVFLIHFSRRKGIRVTMSTVAVIHALSLGYAYCGLVAGHTHEIMYFDALIALPLVADGLYKLCIDGKVLQYYIALAYGIITNFYFGFMLCIFSVLFYVYIMIRYNKVKYIPRFICVSVLSAGTAALVILPMLYQIPKSKLEGEGGEVFNISRFACEVIIILLIMTLVFLLYRLMTSQWYKKHLLGWKCYLVDAYRVQWYPKSVLRQA